MTNPDQTHHEKVCAIFVAVRRLAPDERGAYLDKACGSDAELRRDVEMFLSVDEEDGDALATQALGDRFEEFVAQAIVGDDALPESIGKYRIIRKIGEGGMGVVYEARQENPHRSVALKVIRPGVTTPKLLRRFQHEAQVLGRLQHPGVAHIYEAGVADTGQGMQPFFAMELIEGRPLLEHINHYQLSASQRFTLLANICDAVEHAHQKGVIHRDLKPANILVTNAGHPKVLDFGVARATDSDVQVTTMQTDVGQLIGTLAYMSPEQVVADPLALDTRSDVYALGVLAYEVLAGRLPYDIGNRMIHEAARVIREDDPTSIGTIDRSLRGDVETMLLKALEKDKTRRYQSAGEFAADIRHFLKDEPIVARPASTFYQVRKFAKRHRTLVSGVVATFLALVIGLVVSISMYWQAERARDSESEQRAIAQLEADKAKAINDFILTGLLESSNPWKTYSRDVSMVDVLDNLAASASETFTDQPAQEAESRHTLGVTYNGLGDFEKAIEQFNIAAQLRRKLHPDGHDDLAESLLQVAFTLNTSGQYDEAEMNARESLSILQKLHDDTDKSVIRCKTALGQILMRMGDYQAAEPILRESLELRRKYLGDDLQQVARGANQLGSLLNAVDRNEEAEPLMREAYDICKKIKPDHPATASCINDLAAVVRELGRTDEAIELYQISLAMYQKHLGPENHRTLGVKRNLANALRMDGNIEEAEPLLRDVADVSERTLGLEHPDTLIALNTLALLLHKSDRIEEAAPIYARVVEISKNTLGANHRDTLSATYNLAWLHRNRKKPEIAEPLFREVVAGFRAKLGDTHGDTITVMGGLAQCLVELGKLEEAETVYRTILEAHQAKLGESAPGLAKPLNQLSDVLLAQKKFDAALPFMSQCLAILKSGPLADHWQIAELRSKMGGCLSNLGRFAEAESNLLESFEALEKNDEAPNRAIVEALDRIIAMYELLGDSVEVETYRTRRFERQSE
ncbi:MAG: hypothetical protein DHS20C16_10450 [Phycisphaerae bacterium]|nr:MAG: hypothetical protein DHS20C16_10450 [Phycisphaerae bacterium]